MRISKNEILLQVNILKEGSQYVAHSPALDLSSCGKTEAEAQRNLQNAVTLFFEELREMGTLDEVLLELGWRRADTPRVGWVPPYLLNREVRISFPKIK